MVTPTTSDINSAIISQLETALSQTIPIFPKSFIRVLSKTLSGVFIIIYKYAGFSFLQIFIKTASIDYTEVNGQSVSPLIEWGRLVGSGDPIPAVQAEMTITVTVTLQTGTLPSGSQLINSNNGVTYLTISTIPLDSSTKQVTIRASSDPSGGLGAGDIGNLQVGDEVTFANPLPNVNRVAVVASQTVTGADGEDTEVYRQRISNFFKRRPQGGAYSDYRLWGLESSGIINIYPYRSVVPGVVAIYAEATPASSGSADGIPTSAQLIAVNNLIQYDSGGLATRRPVGALVDVNSIYRTSFDVTIDSLVVDNEAQVQSDIEDAIEEYFLSLEPYIEGLSIPPRKDVISISSLGGIVSGVVSSAGGTFVDIIIYKGGISTTLYILQEGEKAKSGTVSFI